MEKRNLDHQNHLQSMITKHKLFIFATKLKKTKNYTQMTSS